MIIDFLFGSLPFNYCIFFYLLSITDILLIICMFLLLYIYPNLLRNTYLILFLILFFVMLYFQNRILYNMCLNKSILEGYDFSQDLISVNVISEIDDYIAKEKKIWDSQYPTIKINIGSIQNKLDLIDKNTKPLQYKTIV